MPKRVFWPAAFISMGLIFLAANLGLLPRNLLNFWPLIFIVAGLGGLVTSDRDEWMNKDCEEEKPVRRAQAKKTTPAKKKGRK